MQADLTSNDPALAYQSFALGRVSRTFALTIPLLPKEIRFAIGNAYLLCRIADTIEDEPKLESEDKRRFLQRFSDVVCRNGSASAFAKDLESLLTNGTNANERNLVANTSLVVDFHRELAHSQGEAVARCIEIMCEGMSRFVGTDSEGLSDLEQVDHYCYCVAGVVGEMITDLLCDYSHEIASCRNELFALSSRFGCGLQLINIMKDHWEDRIRGVCWLPRRISKASTDPKNSPPDAIPSTEWKIVELLRLTRNCLEKSLRYITLIPKHEVGIRRFLGWTLAFASLTYRRIHDNPKFLKGEDVKISRRQVFGSVTAVNCALGSNQALRWLFNATVPRLSAIETLVRQARR